MCKMVIDAYTSSMIFTIILHYKNALFWTDFTLFLSVYFPFFIFYYNIFFILSHLIIIHLLCNISVIYSLFMFLSIVVLWSKSALLLCLLAVLKQEIIKLYQHLALYQTYGYYVHLSDCLLNTAAILMISSGLSNTKTLWWKKYKSVSKLQTA